MTGEYGPERFVEGEFARILDVAHLEDEYGKYCSLFLDETARGRDVLATIRYYQPQEDRYRRKIDRLFDEIVATRLTKEMLELGHPASSSGFAPDISGYRDDSAPDPREVHDSLIVACKGNMDKVFAIKQAAVCGVIDSGSCADTYIVFENDNEFGDVSLGAELEEINKLFEE